MLYFFLSYGRTNDDKYVGRFFDDLCNEVRTQAGLSGNLDVGFLDIVSIRPGMLPWEEIAKALAECRVFLPLYSRRLFKSAPCGREWTAFDRRIMRQTESGGRRPEGLLPLLWRACAIPPVAARPQYSWAGFGDEYRKEGISALYRFRDADCVAARPRFVDRLAEQIVRIAEGEALVAGDPLADVDALPSAFGLPEEAEKRRQEQLRGPGYLHAVLASGAQDEMYDIRSDQTCYGAVTTDWRPYHPSRKRVLDVLEACGAERNFHPEPANVRGLGARLADARRSSEVVALVSDPWAARIPRHRDGLVEFDEALALGSASTPPMFVPWSLADDETQRFRATLETELTELMPVAHGMNLIRRTDLDSVDGFERVVARDVAAAWDDVLQTDDPNRTVIGEQPPEFPRIEAP